MVLAAANDSVAKLPAAVAADTVTLPPAANTGMFVIAAVDIPAVLPDIETVEVPPPPPAPPLMDIVAA
jgi:hypothetical protein